MGYLMPNSSLSKNSSGTVLFNIAGEDKGVHTFPENISPKVNIIMQLEFKLAYFNVAVQHVSHYTTTTPPPPQWECINVSKYNIEYI